MPRPEYHALKRHPRNDRRVEEEEEESKETKSNIKAYLLSLGRDILIAVIVMAIVIGSLWGYTGNWPPMVVIESNSMMHGKDSNIGIIDTGDLVLVKEDNDIETYIDGYKSNYQTYGSYGDVIIFKKNGLEDTPVIHRAVVWLEYNESGYNMVRINNKAYSVRGFDVPSMGLYNVTHIWIANYKPNGHNLSMNLGTILVNFQIYGTPHSGFLTKGDNNLMVDQLSSLIDKDGHPVEPIQTNWIIGKAEGELPWFGLIKLYISGDTSHPSSKPPATSVNMLVLSIALIIIIPITLDLLFTFLGKYLKKRKTESEEDVDSIQKLSIKQRTQQFRGPTESRINEFNRSRTQQFPKTRRPSSFDPDLERRNLQSRADPKVIPKDVLLKKIK